jgi:hypothetical protein
MTNLDLPQIESRFPTVLPNLEQSGHLLGMKNAARILDRAPEYGKSNLSNPITAWALHRFLRVTYRLNRFPGECVFLDAPRWHTACKCCCNGTKHEPSRTLPRESHPVLLVSRDSSRRVAPGLCRSRRIRPGTAPSLKALECRCYGCTVHRVRAVGRPAVIHRNGCQYDEHGRELERQWNVRRECHGWHDRCGRRLHCSGESSNAGIGVRGGHQRRGQFQEFGCARNDFKRHFHFRRASNHAGGTWSLTSIHGHGKFSRES